LSFEAEYIACSEASRERIWLLQLCKDTKRNDDKNDNDKNDKNDKNNEPLPILCDNEGALALIINGAI